jgi:hypothetical protein
MLPRAGAPQPRLADLRRGWGDPREDDPRRPSATCRPGLAADEDEELARWRVGLLALIGLDLLLTSELTDRLERLEGNVGLGALNLIFATLIATVIVSTAALVGDSILAASERRTGRRPGAYLVTPLLAVSGGAAVTGILPPI